MQRIETKLKQANLWDRTVENELRSLWKYGIERIADAQIKEGVIDFLENEAPLGFFVNSASSTGTHHPVWQTKKSGILRNTVECCLAVDRQLRIYKEFCDENDNVLPQPRDIVIAATILSDTFKYGEKILGVNSALESKMLQDHGKISADVWKNKIAPRHPAIPAKIAAQIYEAVYWHLGRWTPGWTPDTKLGLLAEITHRIDITFADKALELIYEPKKIIE